MPTIHPTTLAIVAGLRGEAHSGSALEQGLTLEVHRLVAETRRDGADEIAKVGLVGWDLAFRHEGSRHEITARFRDDRGYEVLLTAMIDRRKKIGWTYAWLVQGENPATAFPTELYPNGAAASFLEAAGLARPKLDNSA
jgi:hypothetical protein